MDKFERNTRRRKRGDKVQMRKHRNSAKYGIEEKLETPVDPEGRPPTELTVLQSLGLGDVDSPRSLPE